MNNDQFFDLVERHMKLQLTAAEFTILETLVTEDKTYMQLFLKATDKYYPKRDHKMPWEKKGN